VGEGKAGEAMGDRCQSVTGLGKGRALPKPYLSNGDSVGEFYCPKPIIFRTFENGGIGHFKTQKKNPILVGTHM